MRIRTPIACRMSTPLHAMLPQFFERQIEVSGDILRNMDDESSDSRILKKRYMVVERFRDAPAIYRRLNERGRMMPEGLQYVSSWIEENLKVCFQLVLLCYKT